MSVSKVRSAAANGNSRVIPAQAGIQEVARMSVSEVRSAAANGNSRVIPAQAGIEDQIVRIEHEVVL